MRDRSTLGNAKQVFQIQGECPVLLPARFRVGPREESKIYKTVYEELQFG